MEWHYHEIQFSTCKPTNIQCLNIITALHVCTCTSELVRMKLKPIPATTLKASYCVITILCTRISQWAFINIYIEKITYSTMMPSYQCNWPSLQLKQNHSDMNNFQCQWYYYGHKTAHTYQHLNTHYQDQLYKKNKYKHMHKFRELTFTSTLIIL